LKSVNIRIEEVSPVKKRIICDVPWETVDNELKSIYRSIGKNASVPGFRKGKVPLNILRSRYQKEAESEAITNLVTKYYADAVRENNIPVVDQPSITQDGITPETDFAFTADVEVAPDIEPTDYAGLSLEKGEVKISKKMIQDRIDQVRNMYATMEAVADDRDAREGDHVIVDFTGVVDGFEREELVQKNFPVQLGSHNIFEEFETELTGAKKGDTKEIHLVIPDTFGSEELRGKSADFTVTVNDIREKRVPAFDEEFLKYFEKYETLDDLRNDIEKSLRDEEEARVKSELKEAVIDQLLERNEFEVPDVYVNRQIALMTYNAQRRMVGGGMDPDEAINLSPEMRQRFEAPAVRFVKASLILDEIAEKENITVGDEEIDGKMADFARMYGRDVASWKETEDGEKIRTRIADDLREEKTVDYIIEQATVKTVTRKKSKKEETAE